MKKLLSLIVLLFPISAFALELINNFEWLEPNNSIEIVVGEQSQLKFNCSDNSLPFTSDYVDSWVHYDFDGGQHVVNSPTGYSIDNKGVITGLAPGSYAIKFTGWIQPQSGVDKMLMITVVSERSETESNNTFDTANEIISKIRFGLYNTSDIDYFKYSNSSLKWGDEVTFKIHYFGSRENPSGYKWFTFCETNMSSSGNIQSQDQICKALVSSGNTVYLEVYYDINSSQYFNYGEEFVAEVYINGVPASEYGNDISEGFDGEGTENVPYLIKNASNLKQLANNVNSGNSYSNTYFELSGNIDMTGEAFVPIGNQNNHFSGKFDGKGFVIKGISVNANSCIGLFGYIENAFINDVGVEDVNYTGRSNIGGIAGYSLNSVISNCYSRGITNGNDCVGALVGYSGEGTVIQNCFSSMQHTKYEIYGSVGGLVGYNCGKLENSYFYGTINAKIFEKSTTGGIVGYNHTTGSIHYCYFIKYGDVMNGEFNYCGSLNWGNCHGTDSFDLYGITTSGSYLHTKLNTWVDDHSNDGRYRKWTSTSFPSFSEYAESVDPSDNKDFVDLGLPSGLLWAKTNLGANSPEETGYYYAWGETIPNKSLYDETTYTDPHVSNISGTEYDAAFTTSGGKSRIPKYAEFLELINCCTWEYTRVNSINGYKVIGPNGNSIFLPFVGGKEDDYNVGYSEYGYSGQGFYVSGTAFPYDSDYNWYLYMDTDPRFGMYGYKKTRGQTIRPVQELSYLIEGITLNHTSVALFEGEELILTVTISPENATDKIVKWSSSNIAVATVDGVGKVTAVAPGIATITAMANDGSGVSASCEIVVNELILGKCATPVISYTDGKVIFACDTEGAKVKSSVRENSTGDFENLEFDLIPTYTITAYATKEHYENSDVATIALCWIPCKEEHKEDNGILTIPAKPVLISTQRGTIYVSGLADGTEVSAYNTAGIQLVTATATDGAATLATGLEAGSIAIVKMGDSSVKVAVR